MMAIRYEVEPIRGTARVVLQSELVANEPLPAGGDDPRAAAVPNPLVGEYKAMHDHSAVLVHSTGRSLLRTATGYGPRDRGAVRESTSTSTSTTTSPGRR